LLAAIVNCNFNRSMTDVRRYSPERPLPAYSYVSGLSPHPVSDPRGHSYRAAHSKVEPLDESSYTTNANYLYAIDLFNHGYYWEAHEEWERLWHAAGRNGSTADFLKGLIKLAAAGVKLREGRAAGVVQHARRASELIANAAGRDEKQMMFGLSPAEIHRVADNLVMNSGRLVANGQPDAGRSLGFVLQLENR